MFQLGMWERLAYDVPKDKVLTAQESAQLLKQCIKAGAIKEQVADEKRFLLMPVIDNKTGKRSVEAVSFPEVADAIFHDVNAQHHLRNELESHGIKVHFYDMECRPALFPDRNYYAVIDISTMEIVKAVTQEEVKEYSELMEKSIEYYNNRPIGTTEAPEKNSGKQEGDLVWYK